MWRSWQQIKADSQRNTKVPYTHTHTHTHTHLHYTLSSHTLTLTWGLFHLHSQAAYQSCYSTDTSPGDWWDRQQCYTKSTGVSLRRVSAASALFHLRRFASDGICSMKSHDAPLISCRVDRLQLKVTTDLRCFHATFLEVTSLFFMVQTVILICCVWFNAPSRESIVRYTAWWSWRPILSYFLH